MLFGKELILLYAIVTFFSRGLPTGHIGGPDYCLRYIDGPLGGHEPLAPSYIPRMTETQVDGDYSVVEGSIKNRVAFTLITDYQSVR